MKRLIQLILFLILVLLGFYVNNKYFKTSEIDKSKLIETKNKVVEYNENNMIKNLTYEVSLEDNSQYIINSEFSEIKYENNVEIVLMNNVIATFVDKNNVRMTITGDNAIFNKSTYNTNFYDNVKATYLDNTVVSDKLDLNFVQNIVTIYDNVVYEGLEGIMKTDNVIINLLTKNAEVFMNNPKKKVEISKKN